MAIKVTKIKPEFTDERGTISRILDQSSYPLRAVLYIVSKKGTERANHYHKKDYHYVYCLSGKLKYSEKDMSKPKAKLQSVVLMPGDMVLSKPNFFHRMQFLEDTVFLAITSEHRSQKKYEKDTVRVNLANE